MMKKLLVIGVVSALVLGLALAASADDSWYVFLRASNMPISADSAGNCKLGTGAGMSDGANLSTPDFDAANAPLPATVAAIASVDLGLGNGDYFKTDMRAPLVSGIKVWNLKLWAGASFPGDNIVLTGWNTTGTGDLDDTTPVALYLVLPGGARQLEWQVDPSVNGTTAAFNFQKTYPKVAKEGAYEFELVAGVVPEPGSMIALLSGLVGLVGLRRRK